MTAMEWMLATKFLEFLYDLFPGGCRVGLLGLGTGGILLNGGPENFVSSKPKLLSENPIHHFLLTFDSRMICLSKQFLSIFLNPSTVVGCASRTLSAVEGVCAYRNMVFRNVVHETQGGGNIVFSTLKCHQIFMIFKESK